MRNLVMAALTLLALSWAGADAAVLIKVDKAAQRMSVIVDGDERHDWPVSTGRAGHLTPVGNFTPFRLEEDHYSKEWDDAPMPHSIFFTKLGHAIHGSFDVKKLGSPASAGCVRLAPKNAETLFALVKASGLANTKVVITGEEQMIARRGSPGRDRAQTGERAQAGLAPEADGVRVRSGDYERPRGEAVVRRRYRDAYEQPMPPVVYERPVYGQRYIYQQPQPQYYYAPRGYGWN